MSTIRYIDGRYQAGTGKKNKELLQARKTKSVEKLEMVPNKHYHYSHHDSDKQWVEKFVIEAEVSRKSLTTP